MDGVIKANIALRWLMGLTLAAVVLRLINLDAGLWLDEIYAIVNQFRLPVTELLTTYIGDNQHPLYAILASLSVSTFGEHAWSARLPAVIFGIATVPALYLFGTQVSNRKEGLLAAALLTFSYHHVWFSQNARGYTALALAAILCSFYFVRLLRGGKNSNLWMYGLIAALGTYAHLTMVFVVVGHFMVYLLQLVFPGNTGHRFTHWKLPLLAFITAGTISLLLYGPILGQVIDYFVNKPSLEGLSTPQWALKEAIRSLSIGFGAGAVVSVGMVMVFVGIGSYLRSNPVALGIFIFPILITILGAFLARGTMYPRFFFALLGMAILIGVRGVMVTVRWSAQKILRGERREMMAERLATAAMIIVILISAASLTRNYQYPKMDFQGAREWVVAHAKPQDRIVSASAAAWVYQKYYGLDWPRMMTASDLINEQNKNSGNLWMVYTFARYIEASAPEVMSAIREHCVDEKRFKGTLGGGDVIVCRMNPIKAKS